MIKDTFFMMRTSPVDRIQIQTVAELADKKSQSEAIRLAVRFAILNAQQFKFWLVEEDD